MTDTREDNGKSFSLKDVKDNKYAHNSDLRTPHDPTLTWEERSFDRLKVLYRAGKLLSTFESFEKTLPELLGLCSTAFPLETAVIIEKRGPSLAQSLWHAENIFEDQINRAMKSSKEMYIFYTDATVEESAEIRSMQMSSGALANIQARINPGVLKPENSISLPLSVDRSSAFGVLQLDGTRPLLTQDLEFADALCDLIAIAIDRYYRVKTEREKRAESEASVTRLESESGLRENFVSLLTHDLRTPLSAAKISAQLIQRQPEISDLTQSLAAKVVSNVSRADQMVTDLLDANRIRSGESIPLNVEGFELTSLVRDALTDLSTVHGDRFVLSAEEKVDGYWDKKAIRRVIENLCSNAVKYGAPDSPIKVVVTQEAETVIVSVHNKGEPIKASEQKTLFQQFRRTQKAHSSRKQGWGIGLTLVRGVAEAHGGTVKLESDEQKGTKFIVTLPLDATSYVPSKEPK